MMTRDDAPFLLKLLGVQQGEAHHIGQQAHRDVEVATGNLGRVHGQLFAGFGVEHAADAFDGLRDRLCGGVALRAFEEHVLDQV
jgi:hypothetical protein